jgi:hypothetical protein
MFIQEKKLFFSKKTQIQKYKKMSNLIRTVARTSTYFPLTSIQSVYRFHAAARVTSLSLSQWRPCRCSFSSMIHDDESAVERTPATLTSPQTADEETAIAALSARVQALFKEGVFDQALPVAQELRKRAFHHFGVRSPVFASAVNNQALILKNLGQLEEAVNLFDLAV